MLFFKVHISFLPVDGMAIFPFILIRDKGKMTDATLINHEKIHLAQQLELLVVPFYILYVINYLQNRLMGMKHDTAYRNILFEKEAYAQELNNAYLKKRRFWNWLGSFY